MTSTKKLGAIPDAIAFLIFFALVCALFAGMCSAEPALGQPPAYRRCTDALTELADVRLMSEQVARKHARVWCLRLYHEDAVFARAIR